MKTLIFGADNLLLSDLCGRTPDQVSFFVIIPASYQSGVELSPMLAGKLPGLAELTAKVHRITKLACTSD